MFVIEAFVRKDMRIRRNVDKLLLREHGENIIINNTLAILLFMEPKRVNDMQQRAPTVEKEKRKHSGFICLR